MGWLKKLFEEKTVVGHNIKFDLSFLYTAGVPIPKRIVDTMLSEQVIHGLGMSEARNKGFGVSLEETCSRYGIPMSKTVRNWFTSEDALTQPFPQAIIDYGEHDVQVLEYILAAQTKALAKHGLTQVARLEWNAVGALVEAECTGVTIDTAGWRGFIASKANEASGYEADALLELGTAILLNRREVYQKEYAEYEQYAALKEEWKAKGALSDFYDTYGRMARPRPPSELPNINSSAQVLQAFATLGIPASDTSAETLEELSEQYPTVEILHKFRKSEKFVSAFGDSLLEKIEDDGRIHSTYVQIGASTGRMSATNPNFQQIPSQADGAMLRKNVVAGAGNIFVVADYANIELRIAADISNDSYMLQLFADERDLHTETARKMYKLGDTLSADEIKAMTHPATGLSYRFMAKKINFGLIYGMSEYALSKILKCSVDEAKEIMKRYFSVYPQLEAWLREQRDHVRATGYSVTMSGRKRFYHLPHQPERPQGRCSPEEYKSYIDAAKSYTQIIRSIERQAMNSPIQGTSADITKLALGEWMKLSHAPARLVAVVHDEFVVETPVVAAEETAKQLATAMVKGAAKLLKRVEIGKPDVHITPFWSK